MTDFLKLEIRKSTSITEHALNIEAKKERFMGQVNLYILRNVKSW